jgi:hypothetical protein
MINLLHFRNITQLRLFQCVISSVLLCLSACGGGGSDNDFVGAALLNVDTTPQRIDPGNRTQTTVYIYDVHQNGIFLKVKYPAGLKYASQSSKLEINGRIITVFPNNIVATADNSSNFLVYVLGKDEFNEAEYGILRFQLEGVKELQNGDIEVDADVDDPQIQNSKEFNVAEPAFNGEDKVSITVIN